MITFWELLLFVKLKSIFKCQIMIQKCQFDAKLVLSFFCHCCHCHIVVTIFVIVSIVTTVALIWFLSESLELENRKYLVIWILKKVINMMIRIDLKCDDINIIFFIQTICRSGLGFLHSTRLYSIHASLYWSCRDPPR